MRAIKKLHHPVEFFDCVHCAGFGTTFSGQKVAKEILFRILSFCYNLCMEPREAIKILLNLRDKYPLDTDEQEAMRLALGVLDSAALSKNRIRGILNKRTEEKKRI